MSSADEIMMPDTGTVRVQPGGYSTVFKPGKPISPVLAWLRNRFPDIFRLRGTWRFEDPRGQYRETYSGTTLEDALIEVLDRYRIDALARELAASVRRPGATRFAYPVGSIPRSEIEDKERFVLKTDERYADVMATRTQSWLSTRPGLMALIRRHMGADVVDSGTVLASGHTARAITHRLSREVYDAADHWTGIRYSSRVGTGHENWMTFDRCNLTVDGPEPLDPDAPQVASAMHELGLHVVHRDVKESTGP